MPRIHPHYTNTRFDSPHGDASGQSRFINLNKEGGFFVTPQELEEYNKIGWSFDLFGFDE